MSEGLQLILNDDGVFEEYDDAYDLTIHCESKEEQEKVLKKLNGGWIPCSERLPEEDDYKSCIECMDGAVWYFTENGTMGLGYYYESVKEWSTTDDLETDGKVVAWMPLPEPYREKGGQE